MKGLKPERDCTNAPPSSNPARAQKARRTYTFDGIVKLFGNVCGAVDVGGLGGER